MLVIVQGMFCGLAHVINLGIGKTVYKHERELGIMKEKLGIMAGGLRGMDFLKERLCLKPKLDQIKQAVWIWK